MNNKSHSNTIFLIQQHIVEAMVAEAYVASPDSSLYQWNGSYYSPQDSSKVYRDVVDAFFAHELAAKDKECETLARAILTRLSNLTWKPEFEAQAQDLISFTNGTISRSALLSGSQRAPFTPSKDQFCTYSLSVAWNPNADTTPVMEHILPMFSGSQERLEEYGRFAKAVLLGDVSHGRALFLYGGPGTGKSTLSNILSMLVPTSHVSSVGIDQLGADNAEYYLAELQHSLLNVGGEISKPNHKAARIIKQLTGGDRVIARPIREQPVKFYNRANLLFFANESFGRGGDTSGAMDDRIRVLEVGRRTRDTEIQIVDFHRWFMDNHSESFVAWAMSLKGSFGKASIYEHDNKVGMDSDQYLEFTKEFLATEGMYLSDILELWRKTQGYSVTSEKMAKELKRCGWIAGEQKRVPGLGRQRLYTPPAGSSVQNQDATETATKTELRQETVAEVKPSPVIDYARQTVTVETEYRPPSTMPRRTSIPSPTLTNREHLELKRQAGW